MLLETTYIYIYTYTFQLGHNNIFLNFCEMRKWNENLLYYQLSTESTKVNFSTFAFDPNKHENSMQKRNFLSNAMSWTLLK